MAGGISQLHLVADGTVVSYPNGWANNRLPIRYYIPNNEFSDDEIIRICRLIKTWEFVIGKTLFERSETQPIAYMGDDKLHTKNEILEIRYTPHLTHYLGVASVRYNDSRFLIAADIFLNRTEYEWVGWNDRYYNPETDEKAPALLETTVIHELGHVLGLGHTSDDKFSVMKGGGAKKEWSEVTYWRDGSGYRVEFRENSHIPSENDIRNIQSIYGCHKEVCDPVILRQALISQQPQFCHDHPLVPIYYQNPKDDGMVF